MYVSVGSYCFSHIEGKANGGVRTDEEEVSASKPANVPF